MFTKKSIFSVIFCLFFATYVHAETILHDLQGKKIPFSTLSGKWIFINYWASWCQPCLEEIPELNRFYAQNKASGNLAMFAVNYDTLPIEEQELLVKQFNIHYPTLKKDPGRSLHLGPIDIVPVTFVFNPQGELVAKLYGGQTVRSLKKVLASN